MSETKWEQRNFRLESEANTQLAVALKERQRDFADVARVLLERWVKDESIATVSLPLYPSTPPRKLNEIITEKVIEQIRDIAWLPGGGLFDVQLFREGHSVFGRRIDHFREEKQVIANRMADWMVQRALAYIRQDPNHQAYFGIDSGTGLYWYFRSLPDCIDKYAEPDELGRFHIITNSVAGSECYGTRSQQMKKENKNKFGGRELSEIVKCTLVGGNLLPRYSAVTGPVTENTLRRIRSDAGDKARFYGLAVGHWIDLPQGTRTPVPLAYGEGQVSFKRTLIDQCDEVFVLAPLGKLFAQTKEATRTAIAATGAPYAWVPIEAVNKVKLVTTRRSRGLLRPLSKQIQERYQQFAQSANPLPEAPLEKIGAILFDFDHREGISIKEQILLDFPHPYEWTREFLSTVFSVELEDWSVLQQITDEYNAQSKGD